MCVGWGLGRGEVGEMTLKTFPESTFNSLVVKILGHPVTGVLPHLNRLFSFLYFLLPPTQIALETEIFSPHFVDSNIAFLLTLTVKLSHTNHSAKPKGLLCNL